MSSDILTSWDEHRTAVDRLLDLARQDVLIHSPDLRHFALDSPSRLNALTRIAKSSQLSRLRIVVRSGEPVRRDNPQLMQMLARHAHRVTLKEIAGSLAHLRDAMLLVDGRHGLIRFDLEQPRSKLLVDEAAEISPYLRRFEEIWQEGGTEIAFTTLGL